MNIIQSVRCVTITAHSSTYGLSNTRYRAAATAAAHYLYIRPYDGKMSTKATMPVRMTPHNHTYTLREQQTSNVFSLYARVSFSNIRIRNSLSLWVCTLSSPARYFRTSNRVEKRRPCTWVKDKQRVYMCGFMTTQTHTATFQTKTKQSNTCSM